MSKRGGFFAVDRWTWAKVCDLGRINEAVAYLVLKQGTGRDNRRSKWSLTAMRKYTGVRWERGAAAVEALVQAGLVRRADDSTREMPRYELPPPDEIARSTHDRILAGLNDYERLLIEQLKKGTRPRLTRATERDLRRLAGLGVVEYRGTSYVVAELRAETEPIWVPNSIVVGVRGAEDAPVRRLRAAQDHWALRLLIDLYQSHHLGDYGGIAPAVLRQPFERELVGEQGIYRVWAFRASTNLSGMWEGPLGPHRHRPQEKGKDHPVWDSVHALRAQGLLSFLPHLYEGDPSTTDAELIHPCAGEPVEQEIGRAAHRAGLALLPQFKREKVTGCWLAPVERAIPNVQMVGVARLRHRPHTRHTSMWYSDLRAAAERWIEKYSRLAAATEDTPDAEPIVLPVGS